jgi:hypothetical protein
MKASRISAGLVLRLGALASILVAVAACGSRQGGPASTLERYSQALDKNQYGAAYEMMSESFRAKHSKEDFIRMMKDNKREARETAARLRGPGGKLEVSAEFTYGFGDSMRLVQEGGRWRIASNPMEFYSQANPRDALRSFLRAYNLKRWDVMLRFVPNKYAERMTVDKMREQFEGPQREDIAAKMHMIEANLDEPITDRGNEARMPYGDRFEVRFVREDSQWKIKDLD